MVNVWLVVRRSVWNYPFGLVMVCLYGFVFAEARLYSDALLQIYYFVVQLYGWRVWLKGRDQSGHVLPETLTFKALAAAVAVTAAGAGTAGWYFSTYTNAAAPWLDAFIAAASVVAQYLQSARKIESWIWWIAVDVVAIGVYFWKGLYPTTALYVIFLVLSGYGLIVWRRRLHQTDQGV